MDVQVLEYLEEKHGFFGFEAEEAAFDRDRRRDGDGKITGTRLSHREVFV
jgi:hypothetical protein